MKSFFSLIILLAASFPVFAGEEEDLQKQLDQLKFQREELESSYLKEKYAFIEEKQKARDELFLMENSSRDLIERRNQIKEEIRSIKKDRAEADERNDAIGMRMAEIRSSYLSLADRLRSFVKLHAPLTTDSDYQAVSGIRTDVEAGKSFITTGASLINCMENLVSCTETSSVFSDDILDEKGALIHGTRIRLGGIFCGYVSADKKNASMLLRSSAGEFKWSRAAADGKAFAEFEDALKSGDKLGYLPVDVMQSSAAYRTVESGNSCISGFFVWFRAGGIVMYAILLICLIALFIIFERICVFCKKGSLAGPSILDSVSEKLAEGKISDARDLCAGTDTPESRLFSAIIDSEGRTGEEDYDVMESVMLKEIPVIEKHLATLKTLGAIAPLMGLLGTVTGMISIFDVITAAGTGDPGLLAGGISEALITTEFGLITAVPAVLAYRLLQNRADDIIRELERGGLIVLNLVRKNRK